MAGADEKKESEPPAAGKGGGAPEDKKGGGGEKSGGGGGDKGDKSPKGDAEVAAVVAPKEIEEVRGRVGTDRCGCGWACVWCLLVQQQPIRCVRVCVVLCREAWHVGFTTGATTPTGLCLVLLSIAPLLIHLAETFSPRESASQSWNRFPD